MPRCEDCFHKNACLSMFEAATGFEFELGESSADRCDDFIPTADVVPRGEEARKVLDELQMRINGAIGGWKNERKVAYTNMQIEMIDFRVGALRYCLHEISELKKKYTEKSK